MDWTKVKREDHPKLIKIFVEAGLPACSFRNGEPKWSAPVDQKVLEKIARDFQTSTPVVNEKPIASPSPAPPPQKRGRGRPKKK